jgi:hypothetical protein
MRTFMWAAPAVFLAMNLCASADTILPGTQIQVRTDQPIEMQAWDRGRVYPARVVQDVFATNGDLTIPRGSYAELVVRRVGPDDMALDLESVTVNGNRYVMDTTGPEYNVEQYRNGAGLIGSIVGAITGGQAEVITRGPEIRVPADSRITFQLQAPLRMLAPY